MAKTEIQSSENLINNLLLNLDNLKVQNETNNNTQINVDFSLQDQLEMLKYETEKLTNEYKMNCNKQQKKIPYPIVTGTYSKKHSKYQTIDDLLFELNNVSKKAYGESHTSTSRITKSRKGSFVDPRRYSDPYKYTILSTLDEAEDDEEDSIYTLKTPSTALPFYGRKNNNLKVSGKSTGILRNRSYSQPERYSYSKYSLNENASLNDKDSTKYFMKLHNSISNEKNTNKEYVKPPRSSSISRSPRKLSGSCLNNKTTDDKLNLKKKGNMGLENKPSFHSDITLVNEE